MSKTVQAPVTAARLLVAIRAAAPSLDAVKAEAWADVLVAPMTARGITTDRQVAGFIGQCAVESDYFTSIDENLNYTMPGRLMAVWPGRFPTVASALPFVGRPQDLACHVYGGRMGNAPAPSLDGWTYRGGGLLQTTGHDSYAKFAAFVGMSIPDSAAFMRTPIGAAQAAAWDWADMGCGPLADAWDLRGLCIRINGGTIGLADRNTACTRALAAIEAVPVSSLVAAVPPAPNPDDSADDLNAAELGAVS